MVKKEKFIPLFVSPLMKIELDLDLEQLTEFAFQLQNKDKKGIKRTNIGGWHSNNIGEEKHEEFIKLKKEMNQHLQTYSESTFAGMKFNENIIQDIRHIWVNINEKHHYNEWHIHPGSTLSGTFYIKHNGSAENGKILFKHPKNLYMITNHWPEGLIEKTNEVTSQYFSITPQSNMLLIFPSWVEHKVGTNLKDDTRISLSFNCQLIQEKNRNG